LEMAEALKANNIETTIVEKQAHILPNLDPDISAQVQVGLLAHGVALRLGSTVTSFIGEKLVNDITVRVASALERAAAPESSFFTNSIAPLRVREVLLENETLPADIVILSAGGQPNVALAVQAGLALGPTGAIAVDNQQRTSVKNIWAAGGVCEVYHRLLKGPVFMPTALNANKQGRVAGTNAAGGQSAFSGTFGASVVKIFDQTLAHTGLTETQSRQYGLDARSVAITGWSRAVYMPQSAPIHLKLVFERGSQRVLGAQMLGHDGVAKRIDVVTAALQAGWTLQNLAELDTTYSPAEAPVWEPLLVAASAADHAN
jgi:NADPH-dependent 2,4-dienoyl-CoA reductase/sulfur reductase-like enzyme